MFMSKPSDGLPENKRDNHLTTINKYILQKCKNALPTSSNINFHMLYNEFLESHSKTFNDGANKQITNSVNTLLRDIDTDNCKTWKSSLSKFTDPMVLFTKTIPQNCNCDANANYMDLDNLFKNNCKCKLPISYKTNKMTSSVDDTRLLFSPPFSSDSSQEDHKQLYVPTFCQRKISNSGHQKTSSTNVIEDKKGDIENVEEENKVHKSNAKTTFKTARQQLLDLNPAYKRQLGASKQSRAKFISPVIGAQDIEEKNEIQEPTVVDDRLKHLDPKMVELIESEIMDNGTSIEWDDIAGLQLAKSVIQEAVVWPLLRPDLFSGLRRPPKGILLFGPPGTGKTLIGKCVAAQCKATFFSISASSLTSKWIGDGEKMVRALFAVARCRQPAVIFIDEIDSLLSRRSDTEHEATRRIKTEFLVQFDGAATEEEDRLLLVGATNRPQELDEAARRRLVKRLYIPLPEADARKQIIVNLLEHVKHDLTCDEILELANLTNGYSGADMKSLCSDAAMGPIRCVPSSQIITIDKDKVRPVSKEDFRNALQRVKPSVSSDDLDQYVKWNKTYGQEF